MHTERRNNQTPRLTPLPEVDPISTTGGRRAIVDRLNKKTFQWLRKHARKTPNAAVMPTFPAATVTNALKELFELHNCRWDPEAVINDPTYARLIVKLEPGLFSRKADRLARSLIHG